MMIVPFFSRRFSSEKCPTITVASFFFFKIAHPDVPLFVHYAHVHLPKVLIT